MQLNRVRWAHLCTKIIKSFNISRINTEEGTPPFRKYHHSLVRRTVYCFTAESATEAKQNTNASCKISLNLSDCQLSEILSQRKLGSSVKETTSPTLRKSVKCWAPWILQHYDKTILFCVTACSVYKSINLYLNTCTITLKATALSSYSVSSENCRQANTTLLWQRTYDAKTEIFLLMLYFIKDWRLSISIIINVSLRRCVIYKVAKLLQSPHLWQH